MPDFSFIYNPQINQYIISAPRRAKRPIEGKEHIVLCPFCIGQEKEDEEIFRISVGTDWSLRVLTNKFPFAPVHEVIVHSPDHHKNFDELPLSQVETILGVFRDRYNLYKDKGTVYIFHNHEQGGGESLPHPHSQLVVIPKEVRLDIPLLVPLEKTYQDTDHFTIFCPRTSQWPDEVWIAPKTKRKTFGEITDGELSNLAFTLHRLLEIFDVRYGYEFPFNFYIYPWRNWYIRIIPRYKILGGFELGTNVFVNTQDSKETIEFIKTHFISPDKEKIFREHRAEYHRGV